MSDTLTRCAGCNQPITHVTPGQWALVDGGERLCPNSEVTPDAMLANGGQGHLPAITPTTTGEDHLTDDMGKGRWEPRADDAFGPHYVTPDGPLTLGEVMATHGGRNKHDALATLNADVATARNTQGAGSHGILRAMDKEPIRFNVRAPREHLSTIASWITSGGPPNATYSFTINGEAQTLDVEILTTRATDA